MKKGLLILLLIVLHDQDIDINDKTVVVVVKISQIKMVSVQCDKDAEDFFVKVLQSCLILIDINASMKIFGNIRVIISTNKYDTDTSLSSSTCTSYSYNKRLS